MAGTGAVMVGFVLSTTVIVWVLVAVFLHASVAVQVRVMTPVLPQPGVVVSAKVTVTAPLVSDAAGGPVTVEAPYSTCTHTCMRQGVSLKGKRGHRVMQ